MNEDFEKQQQLIAETFCASCIKHLDENPLRIANCLARISEQELWQKPNNQTNSIGNLLLHLCGNISQYILSGLGGAADERQRDAEFAASGGWSKADLLEKITGVTQQAVAIVKQLSTESLVNERVVQGFRLTGFGIVVHVVEHYSYHVGQIALYTKLLKDEDLRFYGDADLNARNT